jgi:hypothetical protein
VALVVIGAFLAGALAEGRGYVQRSARTVSKIVADLPEPLDWRRAWAEPAPRMILDVKQRHVDRLEAKREEGLRVGILLSSDEDWVPAKVSVGEESVRADVRLKGDWVGFRSRGPDHLGADKWSFRVDTKGDSTLLGMKQFALQHPGTRGFLYEWLFHRTLEREGVIALRYDFVELTFNGEDWGVYAIEEHFEKRLIEHNRRREGPIVRFNEDALWRDRARDLGTDGGEYQASLVDGFKLGRTLADDTLRPLFVQAASLLEGFRQGALRADQVFDLELLARYFALADLFGGHHVAFFHNLRFYYNPVTSRLEPVGFDADAGSAITRILEVLCHEGAFSEFGRQLFDDPDFTAAYHRNLARFAEDAYLDALLRELGPELERRERIVRREFGRARLDPAKLRANQALIRGFLRPVQGLHAHLGARAEGTPRVKLAVAQSLPVEVLGWRSDGTRVDLPEPLRLPAWSDGTPMRFVDGPALSAAAVSNGSAVRVAYRILGLEEVHEAEVLPWMPDWTTASQHLMRRPPNATDPRFAAFVRVEPGSRRIRIAPGRWTVREDLVLPAGYTVVAGPGTELDLRDGAVVLSRSRLELTGEEDRPVRIRSADGTGGGLLVLQAEGESLLEHVVFEGLRGPHVPATNLTGAVTFYESDVRFERCAFLGARAEDALNVVRARFEIDESRFADTASDAIDGDFAEGTIARTLFERLGNDAIDVSGSVVRVRDVRVVAAGDKALSAGEQSTLDAEGVTIEGGEIALASKDRSELQIRRSSITGARVGMTAYRKKPEFGPGRIVAVGLRLQDVERPHLVEQGSTVIVDAEAIPGTMQRVEEILYGVEYGTASR